MTAISWRCALCPEQASASASRRSSRRRLLVGCNLYELLTSTRIWREMIGRTAQANRVRRAEPRGKSTERSGRTETIVLRRAKTRRSGSPRRNRRRLRRLEDRPITARGTLFQSERNARRHRRCHDRRWRSSAWWRDPDGAIEVRGACRNALRAGASEMEEHGEERHKEIGQRPNGLRTASRFERATGCRVGARSSRPIVEETAPDGRSGFSVPRNSPPAERPSPEGF